MSPARPDLSAEDILAVLNRRGVRYVVIGAFAAIAHGAPIDATYDIDVTPNRDPQNLQRLSRALSDLDARIRVNDLELTQSSSCLQGGRVIRSGWFLET